MTPERWQQIMKIWDHYLDLTAAEQPDYLQEVRLQQPTVAEELESLLKQHHAESSLLLVEQFPSTLWELAEEQLDQQEMPTGDYNTDAARASEESGTKEDPNASRESKLPEQIGNYHIEAKIGQGGMGVVYKGHHEMLGRTVAIKMIRAGALADEDELARFLVEARAIAALQHPNIIAIYEIDEHEGNPFFSLEYVKGGNLAEHLGRRPSPPRQAAGFVEKLARAMHVAHQHGIIHRDLKPANILLTEEKEPKITDFGLAKEFTETSDGNKLTVRGAVMGTPAYMAPEQARGDLDLFGPGLDVYALGAILFEMLTGEAPFRGSSLAQILRQVQEVEAPSPSTKVSTIHRDLSTICSKCLQKRIADRYASAEELADDLERFLNGEPITARPVSRTERFWRWCQRNPTVATLSIAMTLALVVLVVGGGIAWNIKLLADANERARDNAEKYADSQKQQATTDQYHALVYGARRRIASQSLGWIGLSLAELGKAAQLETPARNNVDLRSEVATCLSGIELRQSAILPGFEASRVAYSSDGKWVALAQQRALGWIFPCVVQLLDSETGKVVRTLEFMPDVQWSSKHVADGISALAYSPDGQAVAVCTTSGWIHRWDLTGKAKKPVHSWKPASSRDGRTAHLVFSADSQRLYSSFEGDHLVFCYDLSESSEPRELYRHEAHFPVEGLAIDPNGKHLAIVGNDGLHLLHQETLEVEQTLCSGKCTAVVYSPDGEILAVAEQVGRKGQAIRLIHHGTGEVIRTLREPRSEVSHLGEVEHLAFSPDGALLGSQTVQGSNEIALWETVGGQLLATYVSQTSLCHHFGFAPTGDRLLTLEHKQRVLHDIVGRRVQTYTAHHPGTVHDFAFAPQGRFLGCLSDNGMSLWSTNTGRRRAHLPLSTDPSHMVKHNTLTFHPQGTLLLGASTANGVVAWNVLGSSVKTLFATGKIQAQAFSKDGTHLWMGPSGDFGSRTYKWPECEHVSSWAKPAFEVISGHRYTQALALGKRIVLVGGIVGLSKIGGGIGGGVHVFRKGDTSPRVSFEISEGMVYSVALSPDERWAVGGTHSGTVRIFDLATEKPSQDLDDHREAVNSVAFSPDGQLLATGSEDRTVRLYLLRRDKFEPLLTLRPITAGPIKKLAFHPDGRILGILARNESAVRLWHLDRLHQRLVGMGLGEKDWVVSPKTKEPIPEPSSLEQSLETVERSMRKGNFDVGQLALLRAVALAPKDVAEPRLWKAMAHWPQPSVPPRELELEGKLRGVAFRPGSSEVLAVGDQAHWVDAKSAQRLDKPAPEHRGKIVSAAAFNGDGTKVMTVGFDGYARLWDAATGESEKEYLFKKKTQVRAVTLGSNTYQFALAGENGYLSFRRVPDGASYASRSYRPHSVQERPRAVQFVPSRKYVIAAGHKGGTVVYKGDVPFPVIAKTTHPAAVDHLSVSPRETTFATYCRDGNVRIWEIPTCRLLATVPLPEQGPGCVAYHPKGRLLAISCKQSVLFVDPETGTILHSFPRVSSEVWGLSYNSDGTTLAGAGNEGTLYLWDVRRESLFDEQRM